HDVAKPRCAGPRESAPDEHTFYDHEKVGARLATEILQRLKFPRRETERVAHLVAEHNWYYRPEWNDATVRRVLARVGPEELPSLWALRRADLKARGRFVEEGLANQDEAEARFQREIDRAAVLKISDLAIGGEDVKRELQLAPGPQVGQVLARLRDRVVESLPRDLRAPLQPGRSSMAEQVPPPQPRILYIEDNPESRALVRNVLEARGFDVLEASDGIAGIDLAISAHPDLILCDIE